MGWLGSVKRLEGVIAGHQLHGSFQVTQPGLKTIPGCVRGEMVRRRWERILYFMGPGRLIWEFCSQFRCLQLREGVGEC